MSVKIGNFFQVKKTGHNFNYNFCNAAPVESNSNMLNLIDGSQDSPPKAPNVSPKKKRERAKTNPLEIVATED